jgi:uroporphyrinogen decarboxylase
MLQHIREANFERLCSTLMNQKADAVPLIELGIDSSIKEKILQRPFNIHSIEDEIDFMRKTGYDFIKIQPTLALNLDRQTTKKNIQSEFQNSAPDRAWSAEHQGIITCWEDFETYPWPSLQDIDYTKFERARKLLPDNMGIIGQYGDIFTTTWELMGFETFAIAIYQDPTLIQALIDRIGKLILNMFDTMADMDWVGALWYSDDIAYASGPMLNPEFFQTYFFPYLKHIGSLCHKRSIPFIYHSDGVLWEFMSEILASGVTALHPIEPKSMNIFEVKEKVGDLLCLCGGIELDLLSRGEKQQVVEMVTQYIEKLAPSGGYCVGSSNSIPEYVNVENYIAMIETTLTIGTW